MSKDPPRVLIVNDDGIDGPGIVLLEKIVRRFTDDIWVIAPDEERSGAGHSMSTYHPIRVKQRDERHFAVKGTPTDCALLGVCHEIEAEVHCFSTRIRAAAETSSGVTPDSASNRPTAKLPGPAAFRAACSAAIS